MGDPTTAAKARRSVGASTMPEAFRLTVEDHPDRVAVRTKDDEVSLTWAQLRDRVDALAGGLAGLGVRRGDTVALMLGNRPEFHIADLAAMTLGAAPFSIYQTFTPAQIAFIVGDAGAKLAIVEEQYLERFLEARAELPALETVVVVGGGARRRHRRLGRGRGRRPGLRSRAALARGRPGGRPDADLHVGHDRAAQGRAARAPQPDGRGQGRRRRDQVPRRLEGDLVAAGGAHRRAQRAPLPADRVRDDDHVLPEPARDRRLPAGRQADLVLRRAADLREAQGGPRGASLRAGRGDRRLADRRAAQGRARAGRRAGARRRRGDRRGGRGEAVRRAARDARARRGDLGQRRRGADAARRARLLPRDRHPARRALGHVGDLRRRRGQPARAVRIGTVGPPSRGSRCGWPTTASCWCAATS